MKKLNVLVVGLMLPLLAAAQTVKSPNGNVSVTFSLTGNGQPTYEMSYKGKTVCKPSHLGLELAKDKHASKGMTETNLMDGFTETGSKTSSFDETWKPVWGETATIRNNYNEMEVNLNQASSKRNITIRFRVYDYGILPLSLGISTLFTGFGRNEPSCKERIRASLLAKSQGSICNNYLCDFMSHPRCVQMMNSNTPFLCIYACKCNCPGSLGFFQYGATKAH